jgi:NAD(P)-dependent dehydrogenase (short-subunit alcohol dehydrogenase family)
MRGNPAKFQARNREQTKMPTRDLSGKICIVTGTGSGLGKAMTLGLAAAGATVAGVDINLDAAKATADEAGKNVTPFACDITNVAEADGTIKAVIEQLGGLHMLVNCAGLGMSMIRRDYWRNRLNFWDIEPNLWQKLMDVNVRGAFLMSRATAPYLLEQKWGRIINVTTSMNTMIRGGNMPYGQSKASLEAASAAWADDFKDSGVTCNVVVPGGAADTPMVPNESPYDREKLVKPTAMVAPICFFASDDSDGINSMRFLGRNWDPDASDEDNIKAAGSPAAWPDLADQAAEGQPRTSIGKDIPR